MHIVYLEIIFRLIRIKTIQEQEKDLITSIAHEVQFQDLNPSQQFSNHFNAYSKAFNNAYERIGSLFHNPFKRIQITSNKHLIQLVKYIHQNPQKHGPIDDFRLWPYSSCQELVLPGSTKLQRKDVYSWFGGLDEFAECHQDLNEVQQINYLNKVEPGQICLLN